MGDTPARKAKPESPMHFAAGPFAITLRNASPDSDGPAAEWPAGATAHDFADPQYRPSSRHVVTCRTPEGAETACVLVAGVGPTGVHAASAVAVGSRLFAAAGDTLCRLTLPALELVWATAVDPATCFGVDYSAAHDCLVSHGEMTIARVGLAGDIVWQAGGADIFSDGFRLDGDAVEAVDFDGRVYRFGIATGELLSENRR